MSGDTGLVEWWIATITAKSKDLRDAGVRSISVGDMSATFDPPPPEPPPALPDVKNDELDLDGVPAIDDPRSYPGGVVPGFKIDKLSRED